MVHLVQSSGQHLALITMQQPLVRFIVSQLRSVFPAYSESWKMAVLQVEFTGNLAE